MYILTPDQAKNNPGLVSFSRVLTDTDRGSRKQVPLLISPDLKTLFIFKRLLSSNKWWEKHSLFCVCFNKRASVWCFLLPELIMIGVGRRERAAIGFYEQKTNKINLLCWVNIWGIFWGAMGLNITNKYGTIVQFIYLWDHPPTVHTPNTEYLLRNLNFAPIPKHFISPSPLLTTAKPEAADVFSVDDTWVCCTGLSSAHGL